MTLTSSSIQFKDWEPNKKLIDVRERRGFEMYFQKVTFLRVSWERRERGGKSNARTSRSNSWGLYLTDRPPFYLSLILVFTSPSVNVKANRAPFSLSLPPFFEPSFRITFDSCHVFSFLSFFSFFFLVLFLSFFLFELLSSLGTKKVFTMGNAIKFPEPPSITWENEAYYIENTLNPVPELKSKSIDLLESQSNPSIKSSLTSPSSGSIAISPGFRNNFNGGSVFTLANENFTKHLAVKIYVKYYALEVINWLLIRRQLLTKLSGAPYIVPIYKSYQVCFAIYSWLVYSPADCFLSFYFLFLKTFSFSFSFNFDIFFLFFKGWRSFLSLDAFLSWWGSCPLSR